MNVSIQKKGALAVAGLKREGIEPALCSAAWEELLGRHAARELEGLGSGQSYGICYDVVDHPRINYMAAYDLRDREAAAGLGLEMMDIPENEYAVVQLKGAIPGSIRAGWKYIMEVFFPEHGYCHSGDPDLEVYREGDMYAPDYEMELWVPIRRAAS